MRPQSNIPCSWQLRDIPDWVYRFDTDSHHANGLIAVQYVANLIYILWDSRTGKVHYVGRTNDPWRRLHTHVTRPQPSMKKWIYELAETAKIPEMLIVDGLWHRRIWVAPEWIEGWDYTPFPADSSQSGLFYGGMVGWEKENQSFLRPSVEGWRVVAGGIARNAYRSLNKSEPAPIIWGDHHRRKGSEFRYLSFTPLVNEWTYIPFPSCQPPETTDIGVLEQKWIYYHASRGADLLNTQIGTSRF